jgi:hypothetical protein
MPSGGRGEHAERLLRGACQAGCGGEHAERQCGTRKEIRSLIAKKIVFSAPVDGSD